MPGALEDMGVIPGSRRSPGEGNGNTGNFLPGESHGQRSLAGYSPWGHQKVRCNLAIKQIYINKIDNQQGPTV